MLATVGVLVHVRERTVNLRQLRTPGLGAPIISYSVPPHIAARNGFLSRADRPR